MAHMNRAITIFKNLIKIRIMNLLENDLKIIQALKLVLMTQR